MMLSVLFFAAALHPAEGEPTPGQAPPPAEQVIVASPSDGPSAHIEAGLRAFWHRRFSAAAVEFQRALDADPQSAAAAFYLGYTYYKIAEPKWPNDPGKRQAAELFARAYALDPGFRPTWTAAGAASPVGAIPTAPTPATAYLSEETRTTGRLTDATVARHASASLQASRARMILDNDEAVRSKLDLVLGAKKTIDAMYYIWSDDYSSSVLTQAMIDAAKRGVRVRLLLDYQTNYGRLDLFSTMEHLARGGVGSLSRSASTTGPRPISFATPPT